MAASSHTLSPEGGVMTRTISTDQAQRLAEIEARERQAWATYQHSLRDLEGRDYEETEDESWDRLQKKLRQLEDERQVVAER
jgi:hypothetical protein